MCVRTCAGIRYTRTHATQDGIVVCNSQNLLKIATDDIYMYVPPIGGMFRTNNVNSKNVCKCTIITIALKFDISKLTKYKELSHRQLKIFPAVFSSHIPNRSHLTSIDQCTA